MIVGFTGTQTGLLSYQIDTLRCLIKNIWPDEIHHGDCIGADDEFDSLFRTFAPRKIVIHPPDNPVKRAFCHNKDTILHKSIVLPEKPYLDRNRDIVDSCELIIACPAEATEILRSGTWSTWRYARRQGRPAIIIV